MNGNGVKELLRTNDSALLSYVEALLRDARIGYFVADRNMSVIEGSLGILPRRVLVPEEALERAVTVIREAGIGGELSVRSAQGDRA